MSCENIFASIKCATFMCEIQWNALKNAVWIWQNDLSFMSMYFGVKTSKIFCEPLKSER